MSPETILLTGGTGYLGSHLLRQLLANGRRVVLIKRSGSDTQRISDLLDQIECYDTDRVPLDSIFESHSFHAVLHCATDYGRQGSGPLDLVETNVHLPLELLTEASQHGVSVFINVDTMLDRETSAYSLSKKQFVDWMELLSGDIACINIALEHFYGPGDHPTKFVTHLVHALITQAASIDLTAGEQKRDFIHIEDVVSAFLAILAQAPRRTGHVTRYQIGSGTPVRIRDLVETLHRLAGRPGTELKFGAVPYRKNEVMHSSVDTSAARALGWAPQVTLEDGLKATIEADRASLAGSIRV